jgi:chromosome segregation ATPase
MTLFSRTPKASAADLDALRSELAQLRSELTKRTNELSFVTAATNGLDQRISAIDIRLTNMTSELSNQLHELSSDIETITQQESNSGSVEALEQLRLSQTRIANEQARYEIAFRQDLAVIAEELRKIK